MTGDMTGMGGAYRTLGEKGYDRKGRQEGKDMSERENMNRRGRL